MAMLVGAVPLAFEGLSIVLPAAIGLAAAGAATIGLATVGAAAIELVDTRSRASAKTVSTNSGSKRDPPPPPPPEDLAKVLAMKMMLDKMLKEALEEKKKKNSDWPETWCRASGVLGQPGMIQDALHLKDKHQWCGHFLSGPASANMGRDKVVHQGVPPKGSKAGVAYQANGHQWLVAWHVPISTTPHDQNKIYVEHGPVAQVDWNLVEKKLDASTNKSKCSRARAKITDGKDAIIAVVFCQ